jgi:hypothetical protein
MTRVISYHFKSLFTQLKSLIFSWYSFFKNRNRFFNHRLLDISRIIFDSEPTRISVFYKMINLTFKGCVVRVSLTFPIFDVKFFYTWLLFLKRFNRNLLPVGKINSIEMFTGGSTSRRFSVNFNIIRLPHFFNIQI